MESTELLFSCRSTVKFQLCAYCGLELGSIAPSAKPEANVNVERLCVELPVTGKGSVPA